MPVAATQSLPLVVSLRGHGLYKYLPGPGPPQNVGNPPAFALEALHHPDAGGRDPFHDVAHFYSIDDLRNKIGAISIMEWHRATAEAVVGREEPIFEEIPVGLLSCYRVDVLRLADASEADLCLLWLSRTEEDPSPEDFAWLRGQSLPNRKEDPAQRGQSIPRRLWRALEYPFLDYDILIATPFNLVRY